MDIVIYVIYFFMDIVIYVIYFSWILLYIRYIFFMDIVIYVIYFSWILLYTLYIFSGYWYIYVTYFSWILLYTLHIFHGYCYLATLNTREGRALYNSITTYRNDYIPDKVGKPFYIFVYCIIIQLKMVILILTHVIHK